MIPSPDYQPKTKYETAMTDLEIARSTRLLPIEQVAASIGIPAEKLEHYGKHIAKLPLDLIGQQKGKLILVTAITATKAGIGKTTVSIGLAPVSYTHLTLPTNSRV